MQYDTSPWPTKDVWISSPEYLVRNADMVVLDCVHRNCWFSHGGCVPGMVPLVGSIHVLLSEGISEG